MMTLISPQIPPLRSLQLPSLRVPCGALLPAAPLGVPNAVAFAPLGYAVRFRLGSNAYAFLPIQKLTTHYATKQKYRNTQKLEIHSATYAESMWKTPSKVESRIYRWNRNRL